MYVDKYNEYGIVSDKYAQGRLNGSEEVKYELLSFTEEKILKTIKIDSQCGKYYSLVFGKNTYVYFEDGCDGTETIKIYNNELKEILAATWENLWTQDDSGNVKKLENGKILTYDYNGNVIKTSKNAYNNVQQLIKDYIVYVENEKLVISNDNDFTKELGDFKKNYTYHAMISGYYDANELSNENEKEAGIYLVVGLGDSEIQDSGMESGIEYYINTKTHETKII